MYVDVGLTAGINVDEQIINMFLTTIQLIRNVKYVDVIYVTYIINNDSMHFLRGNWATFERTKRYSLPLRFN